MAATSPAEKLALMSRVNRAVHAMVRLGVIPARQTHAAQQDLTRRLQADDLEAIALTNQLLSLTGGE